MPSHGTKELPPTPLIPSTKRHLPNINEYSPETYANLLEQENEQLRLRNQKLLDQVKRLDENLAVQRQYGMSLLEKIERYKAELGQRDNTIAEMAESIINVFQQYKTRISDPEQESMYSQFDDSSSGEIEIGVLQL